MPESYNVLFASSNIHKYEEAEKILAEFGINWVFYKQTWWKSKMIHYQK